MQAGKNLAADHTDFADWGTKRKLYPETIMGCRVYPPPQILAALRVVFGAKVDQVVVIENSLIARFHGQVSATTRRRRIYLRGQAMTFFNDPELMLHEYCHVILQWETRKLTVFKYLIESARNRYWNNRYEVEARRFAHDNLQLFFELMER
jgi:hypothetical protein